MCLSVCLCLYVCVCLCTSCLLAVALDSFRLVVVDVDVQRVVRLFTGHTNTITDMVRELQSTDTNASTGLDKKVLITSPSMKQSTSTLQTDVCLVLCTPRGACLNKEEESLDSLGRFPHEVTVFKRKIDQCKVASRLPNLAL